MTKKSLTIIAAIAVIGLLFLVYLAATFESPEGTRTVELEQPIPRAPEPVQRVIESPPVVPVAVEAPVPFEAPVEVVAEPEPEPAEVVQIPSLNTSDSFMLSRVATFEVGARVIDILNPEQIVRQFVVFVENVSQGSLPQLDYPIRRLPQQMAVR